MSLAERPPSLFRRLLWPARLGAGTGPRVRRTSRVPWIPIVIVLVAIAGLVLYLRVPHLRPQPRAAGDDSALEEVDPD